LISARKGTDEYNSIMNQIKEDKYKYQIKEENKDDQIQ
jgi:hypothetical protein